MCMSVQALRRLGTSSVYTYVYMGVCACVYTCVCCRDVLLLILTQIHLSLSSLHVPVFRENVPELDWLGSKPDSTMCW